MLATLENFHEVSYSGNPPRIQLVGLHGQTRVLQYLTNNTPSSLALLATDHRAAWSLTRSDSNGLAKRLKCLQLGSVAAWVSRSPSSLRPLSLSAMCNLLLLAMNLVLIASPCLKKCVTPSYADSQPQRTTAPLLVRYCLLAISYHCGSA